MTNRRKDKRLFEEEATISPVRDRQGQIVNYVAVKRDITAELKLENQLRQAQKMEAVGQLAGGVAHDFNNLLQVILGHADLARQALGQAHPAEENLREILRAANRAAELVRRLLTFSRREALRPVHLNLNDLIAGVMRMLERVIGEHIELAIIPGHELSSVHADPSQLEQVVLNPVSYTHLTLPTIYSV